VNTTANPYRGATVVFATRHGKERQAASAFRRHLDARVVAPDDIDTDRFGTFTGDIPRTKSPLESAAAKAELGIALTGHPYALASEATYTSDWGVLARHHELLLFRDAELGITLTENVAVSTRAHGIVPVADAGRAVEAASRFGFPGTHAVAIAETSSGMVIRKGLAGTAELVSAASELLQLAPSVEIGPDFRAHANPERQRVIAGLAGRMATRLTRSCPACGAPGWGIVGVERGLPCRVCGEPTAGIKADVHGCACCDTTRTVPRAVKAVDPQWSNGCNP
jgi:hypothetical protein